MREIKFRAWDYGKMVHSDGFKDDRNYSEYDHLRFFFETIRGDALVMQYTGLKDKNGKECYFNDLVIIGTSAAVWQVCQDDFGIPSFVAVNAFGLMQTFEEYFIQDINRKRTDFEVIGNIHKNPELV